MFGFAWSQAVTRSAKERGDTVPVVSVFDLRFEVLSAAVVCVCKGAALVVHTPEWVHGAMEGRASLASLWTGESSCHQMVTGLPFREDLDTSFQRHKGVVKDMVVAVDTLTSLRPVWGELDLSEAAVKVQTELVKALWWLTASCGFCVTQRSDANLYSKLHHQFLVRVVAMVQSKQASLSRVPPTEAWEATTAVALRAAQCAWNAYTSAKRAQALARLTGTEEVFQPWVQDLAHTLAVRAKTMIVFCAAPLVNTDTCRVSFQHYTTLCFVLCTLGCGGTGLGKGVSPQGRLAKVLKAADLLSPFQSTVTAGWHNPLAKAMEVMAGEREVWQALVPAYLFEGYEEKGLPELEHPFSLERVRIEAVADDIVHAVRCLPQTGVPPLPACLVE